MLLTARDELGRVGGRRPFQDLSVGETPTSRGGGSNPLLISRRKDQAPILYIGKRMKRDHEPYHKIAL